VHIIVVSDRMATARSITLTGRHLAFGAVSLMTLIVALALFLSYVTVRHAADIRLPVLADLLRSISVEEAEHSRQVVRENINAMAVRLGQMQAQLIRLDSLGERLAAMAGQKYQPSGAASERDGRGGPLVAPASLSPSELQKALDMLSHQVETRSELLSRLEEQLLEERIRKSLLPTTLPVKDAPWAASAFGWRIDPFTGQSAMHEGVDFVAEPGTPIHAAAAGVVINVERHPQYGNMVEIDHGDDLVTRYAHAARVTARVGALVKRGDKIAEVGSTGRSTGPHLHFEVRLRGAAVNPARFLEQAKSAPLARR